MTELLTIDLNFCVKLFVDSLAAKTCPPQTSTPPPPHQQPTLAKIETHFRLQFRFYSYTWSHRQIHMFCSVIIVNFAFCPFVKGAREPSKQSYKATFKAVLTAVGMPKALQTKCKICFWGPRMVQYGF